MYIAHLDRLIRNKHNKRKEIGDEDGIAKGRRLLFVEELRPGIHSTTEDDWPGD